jgi:outer membrane protein assembly factor BamA
MAVGLVWLTLTMGLLTVTPWVEAAEVALVLSTTADSSGDLQRYLRQDREWLRIQPSLLLAMPAPDSLSAMRRWLDRVRAVGGLPDGHFTTVEAEGTEAVPGGRSLLSLLRDRWLARGHLAVNLVPHPTDHPDTIVVTPGVLFRLGRVEVGGEDFPGRQWLLQSYLPSRGAPFRAEAWEVSVQKLLTGVGDQGYPFARWLVKDVQLDGAAAEVDLAAVLIPGVRAYLGPQTSDLPGGKGQSYLNKATGLRAGRLFRQSDLERARERLLVRGHYRQVGDPVVYLTTASDTVGVHWPVQLRERANRVAVILGFNQDSDGGGGRISGQVDLMLPNLAGSGRRLALSWSDDGRDRSHLGFGYLEPFAFSTPLDAMLDIDHEVLTDQYTRFRIDTRAQLPVVAAWGIEMGLGWDRTTFPSGAVERTSRLRGRGAFMHRRGSATRSGWSGIFALEGASRKATARADTTGGGSSSAIVSQQRQTIVEFDLDGELWLGRVLSIYSRTTYREVSGEGEPIPLSEQYWLGGAKSVRGYRENEFHGERIAYGSVEMRVGQYGGARLYTFFDLGYFDFSALVPTLENPLRREERSGTMYGFGMGLQTKMPGGDISLAVGFPGTVDFGVAKLHVALLEAF